MNKEREIEFGPDEIKRLREAMGLSQSGLAAKMGIDYHTVMRWERGQTRPSGMALGLLRELYERQRASSPVDG